MEDILLVLIYTFGVGFVGTGLGGLIGALIKKDSNKQTSLLLSAAGGVMLSVVSFELVGQAVGSLGDMSHILASLIVTVSILLGVGLIYLGNKVLDDYTEKRNAHIDEFHPKTHDDLNELIHSDEYNNAKNKKEMFKAGMIMVFAIALHNFPEGLSVGSTFISSKSTGIFLAVLLAVHKIPEGMAIVMPLINGGTSKKKAILITALSGLPTMLGAVIGLAIGSFGPLGQAISLSLASGAMVYVIFCEIIPQSTLMYKSKSPGFFTIFGFILGKLLMDFIEFLLTILQK